MAERPWTAGPWEMRIDHEYGAKGLYPVWYVHTPENRVGIARQPAFSETKRGEANARLISAAPEMAEVLLDVMTETSRLMLSAAAAIRTGKVPDDIAEMALSAEMAAERGRAALRKAGMEGV